MDEIQLNSEMFFARCTKIAERLEVPLVAILGKSSDVLDFNMNSALFHYILGYEFPETIVIIQKNPIVIASPKKAILLQQIDKLKVIVRNKDDSNLESILDTLPGVYGIVDRENIRGELPAKVLSRLHTIDVTSKILNLMSVKEETEIECISKAGVVADHLLTKGIDLIRDDSFSKDALEAFMDDKLHGINAKLSDFSFDPEASANHLRIGVRYKGYCVEVARRFMDDISDEYELEKHILSIIRPDVSTCDVLKQAEQFMKSRGIDKRLKIYTIGLGKHEIDFSSGFVLENRMSFCVNIDNEFCNTFVLRDIPVFVTKKDSPEDYSINRMRFRNKSNDTQIVLRIKDHQKELFERLVEDRIKFYTSNKDKESTEEKATQGTIAVYEKDSLVPRSEQVYLDWENFYVLVPILSYSVPFHITTVKNVSIVNQNDMPRLRINFKDSKEVLDACEDDDEWDTKIKFITVRSGNVEDLVAQINEMRKEFNKPKTQSMPVQPVLKEKFKKYALTDVYVRTDNKSVNKKTLGNLELHENGFRYNDTNILFSNIRSIFYQAGDFENRTLLHFELKEPIMHVKSTANLQFFRKFNISYHDTTRREGEEMELLHEKEEEEELDRINMEFSTFVERIEQETNLKVQFPEQAFLGVHSREAVQFFITNECLLSITDLPYFVLSFDDVEVVSFERITFVTKTFDCVFIFKDKRKAPVTIGSIETTKLNYLKQTFDSHNILFMENKVNINWTNLMGTIMENPLSFYENGAWADLLRPEEESEGDTGESEESSSSASSYEDDEEDDTTTSYDDSTVDSDDDDSVGEDDSEEEESEEEESEEEKPKKRRR